jgi:hypothetical protein
MPSYGCASRLPLTLDPLRARVVRLQRFRGIDDLTARGRSPPNWATRSGPCGGP